jgi:hypothetical protein
MLRATTAYFVATLLAFQPEAANVPLDVQLPAFLKALSFDRNLVESDGELAIGVVFDPKDKGSESTKDRLLEIHRELTRLRVKGQRVRLVAIPYESESSLSAAGVKVLLIAPLSSSSLESVVRESARSDFLTLATDASDLDRGLAMGMEMDGGRPRFVVNLDAAVDAGASFESSFLTLCRIVEK